MRVETVFVLDAAWPRIAGYCGRGREFRCAAASRAGRRCNERSSPNPVAAILAALRWSVPSAWLRSLTRPVVGLVSFQKNWKLVRSTSSRKSSSSRVNRYLVGSFSKSGGRSGACCVGGGVAGLPRAARAARREEEPRQPVEARRSQSRREVRSDSPGAPKSGRMRQPGAQRGLVSPVHRQDHFTRGACGRAQRIQSSYQCLIRKIGKGETK